MTSDDIFVIIQNKNDNIKKFKVNSWSKYSAFSFWFISLILYDLKMGLE